MNYIKIIIISLALAIAFTSSVSAQSRKSYFYMSQVGVWFGPITPLGDTDEHIDTNLGGGAFFRYQLPWNILKLGFDVSYQEYNSLGINSLQMVPMRLEALFYLPFKKLPVNLQVKVGAGAAYLHPMPRDIHTVDPLIVAGFEISFPAGRIVNIGARIEYMYLIEFFNDPNAKGGHFLNAGISIYFNIF